MRGGGAGGSRAQGGCAGGGAAVGTVCGRWTGSERVPDLRLSAVAGGRRGFGLGQAYEVEVRAGRLVIRAV